MLSSQLRPQSYDAPFHPLDSPLCYISLTKWLETKWKEAVGERERERGGGIAAGQARDRIFINGY